jgi:hypothetical protein
MTDEQYKDIGRCIIVIFLMQGATLGLLIAHVIAG